MKQMFCSGPGMPPELPSLRVGISLKSKITVKAIVLEIVLSISNFVWDQITERFILVAFIGVIYAKTTFKYLISDYRIE